MLLNNTFKTTKKLKKCRFPNRLVDKEKALHRGRELILVAPFELTSAHGAPRHAVRRIR
jgi:hypothetical protein